LAIAEKLKRGVVHNRGRELKTERRAVMLAASIVLSFIAFDRIAESQQKPFGNVDWILVIDTSKSMRGAALEAQNVFEDVKEQAKQFIHMARDDDSIAMYTFGEKPELIRSVFIRNSYDRQDLLDGVQSLRAEANWTYTGDAVQKALNRAEVVRDKYSDTSREVVIVLFTDDKEDHNPSVPSKYLKDIPISKSKYRPYTFIVYLNRNEIPKDLHDFVKTYGDDRASIERFSTPAQIGGIREKVVQALLPIVKVSPISLSFGLIEPGSTTDAQAVNVYSTKPISLSASLEGETHNGVSLVEPVAPIILDERERRVEFRLKADRNQADSDYVGAIVLGITPLSSVNDQNDTEVPVSPQSDSSIRIAFSVPIVRVPFLKKVQKLAPYLIGGLFLFYLMAYAKLGGHPLSVIRTRRWLEGHLVILKPGVDGLNNTINLSNLHRRRVKLSEIQAGMLRTYLEGSDAELTTVHRDGAKLINIKRVAGEVLRVQETDVSSTDLKDGETIEIGDLELRYRGYQTEIARAQFQD
jgi:VWA domain-containing protein